ncbi:hypothetical protein BDV40DRAFT_268570 [Aspergillus tamarii]|uniref:Uncharacterized protein n=1 Tax=Aspergillus tamarii TaxID=41984 RepID=A0A5N6UR77_ASPTM|nr:hypothetical protein BDV40DRAFT_268570 [Aspergillus tamarii]
MTDVCCNIIPDSLLYRQMDNHTVAIPLSIVLSLSFYSPSCLLIVFCLFIYFFKL